MMNIAYYRRELEDVIGRAVTLEKSLRQDSPGNMEIKGIADSLYEALKWVRGVGKFEFNIAGEHGKFMEAYNHLRTLRSQELIQARRMLESLGKILKMEEEIR